VKTSILILALFLFACTPPIINRATLIENLDLILQLEEKTDILKQRVNLLIYFGVYPVEIALEIKQHRDVYYPYYLIANYYLAHGQLEKYEEAFRLAEAELIAMEELINESIKSNAPDRGSVF